MKRIINLVFFILFINVSCSQDNQKNKVTFENELTYKMKNKQQLWYISNKYPELILMKNVSLSKDFLYYYGNVSSYRLNENNEIEYYRIEFKSENEKEIKEITKSEKTEVINGFKCDKFIVHSNSYIFEIFITNKSKINNINYLNTLIGNKDKSIFKSGLIVKINIFNYMEEKFKPFMELENISKSDKSIFVDFEKLNLRLNKPDTDDYPTYEIIEEVRD